MANTNKPFGLAPVRSISGTWSQQTTTYVIPSTDTNAYYLGDVVLSLADADANGVPGVVKATSGTETLRGVLVGVYPANVNVPSLQGTVLDLGITSIPATKARDYYVQVVDDPNVVFKVQGDATATLQVAASANKNCSLTIAAGASTVSCSGTVINSSTISTTSTLNIKLMGLVQVPNNAFGAYAQWYCKINCHELQSVGTTGV